MASGRFIPREESDKKSELFRHYLERYGVLEAITKALAKLYALEEKPEDPMSFVVKELDGSLPGRVADIALQGAFESAMRDNEKLLEKIDEMEQELRLLRGMSSEEEDRKKEKDIDSAVENMKISDESAETEEEEKREEEKRGKKKKEEDSAEEE